MKHSAIIKRFFALLLASAMILISFSGCQSNKTKKGNDDDSESESSTENSENPELTDAFFLNLVEKGVLDKETDLDSNVTNQLFVAMLVEGFDYELSETESEIKTVEEIFIPYFVTAIENGLVGYEVTTVAPLDAVGNDIIAWTRNAMHSDMGNDDIFSNVGEGNMSVKDAASLIQNAFARYKSQFSVREDASNTLLLQDGVKTTQSSETANVIVSTDASNKTVTFSSPDDVVKNLATDNVLYISPSESLPEGFLAKIVSKSEVDGNVVITCSEPELYEVIKEADISTVISINGALENGARTTAGTKKEDDTLKYELIYSYFDPGMKNTEDGLKWKANASTNTLTTLRFATPGFEKKEGLYAEATLSLELFFDLILLGTNTEIKTFELSAEAISTIKGLAGYHAEMSLVEGGEPFVLDLEEVVFPVAGPLSVSLLPRLIINAYGEITVEIEPVIKNTCSFSIGTNGPPVYSSTPVATINLNAEGEGGLEAGAGLLVGCCLIGIPFLDAIGVDTDYNIVELDVRTGAGIRGVLDSDITLDAEDGLVREPDENGHVHLCYTCIDGSIYAFDEIGIGFGKEIRELIKNLTSLDISYDRERKEFELGKWYFSIGDGHEPEFGRGLCPYDGYEVTINVIDSNSNKPIPGVAVTVGNYKGITNENGKKIFYLENGAYAVNAVSTLCSPKSSRTVIAVNNDATEITIKLTLKTDYYKFIKETLVPQYGLAPLDKKTGIMTAGDKDFGTVSQYEGKGLASARITDLNGDDTPELIVILFKDLTSDYDGEPYLALCMDVYTVDEDGSIVKMNDEDINLHWNDSINPYGFSVALGEINGQPCILTEDTNRTIWAGSGAYRGFDVYGCDKNGKFKRLYYLGDVSVKTEWGQGADFELQDYTNSETPIKTDVTPGYNVDFWGDLKKACEKIGLNLDLKLQPDFSQLLSTRTNSVESIFSIVKNIKNMRFPSANFEVVPVDYTNLERILNNY